MISHDFTALDQAFLFLVSDMPILHPKVPRTYVAAGWLSGTR